MAAKSQRFMIEPMNPETTRPEVLVTVPMAPANG